MTESGYASRPGVLGGVAGLAVRLPAPLSKTALTSFRSFHTITFYFEVVARGRRVLMTLVQSK
jgi:hypothetical protein